MHEDNTCQYIFHMKYIDISKPTVYYKIIQKASVLHSHMLDQLNQYKINLYLREIM